MLQKRVEIDAKKAHILAEECNLPLVLARLLLARGIDTAQKAQVFFSADIKYLSSPFDLSGIIEAVAVIKKTIENKGKVVIYGDYDCDGIGATAILYLALKRLGGDVDYFIPTRADDGYGLTIDTAKKVIESQNPNLIITVDCGINSVKEAAYIKDMGVDLIITDHHNPSGDLPDAIVINPKLDADNLDLCGAGVALKLVEALAGQEFALEYLDICAISTIADVVSLTGDNRIIVKNGLQRLSSAKARAGLKALLKKAGHKEGQLVESHTVSFQIAPRLNASGRLSSAIKSLRLLIEDDQSVIDALCDELEAENAHRQELCQSILSEAKERLAAIDVKNSKLIVLVDDDWEGGVIGIAASKIAEYHTRPTLLFSSKDGVYKGSCRSISGVNIHAMLEYCSEYMLQFGGHSMAAGLSILPENLDNLIRKATEYIELYCDPSCFLRRVTYDEELTQGQLNLQFAASIKMFEPFGTDNPKPIFALSTDAKFSQIKTHNHIRAKLNDDTLMVGFKIMDRLTLINSSLSKKLVFYIEIEEFRGKKTLKCYLRSLSIPRAENAEYIASIADKEALRNIYIAMRNAIDGAKLQDMEGLYEFASKRGYVYSLASFKIAFEIFLELNLLYVDKKNTICISNNRVELEDSQLYKYIMDDSDETY